LFLLQVRNDPGLVALELDKYEARMRLFNHGKAMLDYATKEGMEKGVPLAVAKRQLSEQ
jgi:hypothetical protein